MQHMSRLIGGILLVSGTTIGAAMLALPVITSFGGFFPSLALFFFFWIFLFTTAWLLLDVNLSFPGEVNLISMANRTLGAPGRLVCWITYLLLLYSLTSAYISGSAPLFLRSVAYITGWNLPFWVGPLPLLLIFGFFVYLGTASVDRVNRLLMCGLAIAYVLLICFLPAHLQFSLLEHVDLKAIWIAVPIISTSFGFHIIIPTLTTYLHHDVKKLRLTLFVGSFIPFLIYIIWEFLILGVVPLQGDQSLSASWINGEASTTPLSLILQTSWIGSIASIFSFFAIITSFLGVSLSLTDFLTDGLRIKRFSFGRELASLLTFVPPLFFIYAYPRGFLIALQYAGIFVIILLCILPALMAWKLPRYKTKIRRSILLSVLFVSLCVIALDVVQELGLFQQLISVYTEIPEG